MTIYPTLAGRRGWKMAREWLRLGYQHNANCVSSTQNPRYNPRHIHPQDRRTPMTYETILIETPAPGVGLVRLNRPQALNALNGQVTSELFDALETFDADDSIGCMVLTGSDKAFAAGADIKQMVNTDAITMMTGKDFTNWARMRRIAKPIIAAVSGYALGGG